MAVITQAQVLELEQNASFQNISKQFIRDRAIYVAGQDGTAGNTAGLSPVDWAKQRFISKAIIHHPNSQDYQSWASQFSMFLKGQDVWDTDAATTIQAMVASNKFEELANLTFALRAERIEF